MSQVVKIAGVKMSPMPLEALGPMRGKAHEAMLQETIALLDACRGRGLDLLVTPEAVAGIGMNLSTAESVDAPGPYLNAYMDFAKAECCHVAGSCKIREGQRVYNSVAFVGPEGSILGCYHKMVLTQGERDAGLTSGREAVVVDTAIGRIGAAICFDLNFDAARLGVAAKAPDIVVFPSAYHGGLMQALWAYTCRAYFVSSHMEMECGVRDPFGRVVAESNEYDSLPIATANLDYVLVHLDRNLAKFPDLRSRYGDEVTIDVPAHIGPALIASNSEWRTARDIAAEFELELLDDYLRRNAEENDRNRPPALQ